MNEELESPGELPRRRNYPPLSAASLSVMAEATAVVAAERISAVSQAVSSEVHAAIVKEARDLLETAEALHAYPLSNSDQPAFDMSFGYR
ncbi:MAG: hypothetical protein JWO62_648 [Acidimicrobiaceae bacterium]|jgi:hypothetical protein|nr:hypothetical protein [Acidimicrobiaceae bacterium]